MPPATDSGNDKNSNAGAKHGAQGAKQSEPAKPRSKKPLIILGVVVVIAAIIAFFIWFAHRNQVSTDDAYTDGNVVSMAPKVSGYVGDLLIDDNSRVRKGELLLRIDPGTDPAGDECGGGKNGAAAAGRSSIAASRSQLELYRSSHSFGRFHHVAQRATRHLFDGRSDDVLDRDARCLGDCEFQGIAARPLGLSVSPIDLIKLYKALGGGWQA